jgi:hypothetical protein
MSAPTSETRARDEPVALQRAQLNLVAELRDAHIGAHHPDRRRMSARSLRLQAYVAFLLRGPYVVSGFIRTCDAFATGAGAGSGN